MAEKKERMPLPKIASLDDFFTTQEQRDNEVKDYIEDVSIELIDDFPNHPFSVNDDELMNNIVKSIENNGFIPPAIIRPKENGRYEMVAGHRRKRAFIKANKNKMPCIKKELTDDEATILMVDTNINQRQEILPSEKAFAFKMKLEAMKRQGFRTDLETSVPLAQKLENKTSREILGEQSGESQDQIRRYIRLTELIPEILDLVDEKRVAFRPAVEISYLSDENQYALLNIIEFADITPSLAQAIYMKKAEQENRLTTELIEDIMGKEKANQIPKLKLDEGRFEKILPNTLKTSKDKEDFIFKCVEFYVNRQRNKDLSR